MSTSVRTKTQKKQSPLSPHELARAHDRELEKALLTLESACIVINDGDFAHGREDEDRHYWQQRLKNIATPISLALNEYKGPARFHQHYRHKENNVMEPVFESPISLLTKTCETALHACEDLVGAKGTAIRENEQLLEKALRRFLTTVQAA